MVESLSLETVLGKRIHHADGFLSFADFMQAALYEPELGYYETTDVFGKEGDFVTGAELGPWLAYGFSDIISWGWQQLGQPSSWTLLEQGGGTGALMLAILDILQTFPIAMPDRVIAVETSAHMRERQKQAYAQSGINVIQPASLDELDAMDSCLMFCNELPDAFPVRRFTYRQGELFERGVGIASGHFCWRDAQEVLHDGPEIHADLMRAWPEGYISEWNPHLAAWQRQLGRIIHKGYVFCVDYGYSQQEYYRPQRVEGTLLAHYRHQTSEDVLRDPGHCDITAHVDFTTLAHLGAQSGLQPTCFMSQGGWLAQSPLVQTRLQQLAASGSVNAVRDLAHAKRMLMPSGMGETFKLLIQHCSAGDELPPFLSQFNRLHDLNTLVSTA
ncbi:MAG: class I SAM-dependent methyltransferase [Mariprofundaceae bacterium]